ncbi:MAG: hypothetical protein AAGM22_27740 [Acidobacteriota bacterium]
MHPATQALLDQFRSDHLPSRLANVSGNFHALAKSLVATSEGTKYPTELTAGLRKLLEAKDCAVRAVRGVPTEDEGGIKLPSTGFGGG